MSPALTHRSRDLQRLRDEGYDISLVAGMLVVRGIPFVRSDRSIGEGMLVIPLTMAGDQTAQPAAHLAYWGPETPHDYDGKVLRAVAPSPYYGDLGLGLGIKLSHQLCNRPTRREFHDYHEFVTSHAALISMHAKHLDPRVSARSNRSVVAVESGESPFHYMDTATARAGLGALTRKFPRSVGIVGLGGTGSYVLDLVAKTPVGMIHLFDDDTFLQHNAFRAPGAPALQELEARRAKVDHFASIYSKMHTGIIPHRTKLDPTNMALLETVEFVFLCIDDGSAKRPIIEQLEKAGKSFVDVGIGLELGPTGLIGTARVTTSTPRMRDHVRDMGRIPFASGGEPDIYDSNIQVADLNALNAALAVLRWKRLIGFYADGEGEHHMTYDVDGNHMNNVDRVRT